MPNPLEHRIKALIRLQGPLTISEYMALCLGDPERGYYMAREPFGANGDFITAPEVSQMFGELLGLWAVETWERLGRPDPFILAEIGPGRGTLMRDALRAASIRPSFLAAARLHLVETSPRLRAHQASALAAAPLRPAWHDVIGTLPHGPLLVLANEFFDALPIRQYVRDGALWRERVVGLGDDDCLTLGFGPGTLSSADIPPAARDAGNGTVIETGAIANAIMSDLAARIMRDDGALLAIDYGYAETASGDSFQAVHRHTYVDPLANPGEADLTAHVNFDALARAAATTGAFALPLMTQGDFLLGLGLIERAGRLGAAAGADTRARIAAEVERLAAPEEMGTLFKVIAVTRPGRIVAPWG